MRVLITGGTGFLGQHIAKRYLSQGTSEVIALGRNTRVGAELTKQGIRFEPCEIEDLETLKRCMEGVELVVHSAALVRSWGRIQDFFPSNVLGTRAVIQAAQSCGVKRIVNISTASLYFEYRDRIGIREDDPLPSNQATAYASTKLQADLELHAASSASLSVISLRPRAVFGVGDSTIFPTLLKAYDAASLKLIDQGRAKVDFTCVENLVDAVLLAALAPDSLRDRVYNISNGEPQEIRHVVESLLKATGRESSIPSVSFPIAYLGAALEELRAKMLASPEGPRLTRYAVGLMGKSQTLDISRARNELGYTPRVSFEEGFSKMLQSLQE